MYVGNRWPEIGKVRLGRLAPVPLNIFINPKVVIYREYKYGSIVFRTKQIRPDVIMIISCIKWYIFLCIFK